MSQSMRAWLDYLIPFAWLPDGFVFHVLSRGEKTGRRVCPFTDGFPSTVAILAELFARLPTGLWGQQQGRDRTPPQHHPKTPPHTVATILSLCCHWH
jgi:hypothetical protein